MVIRRPTGDQSCNALIFRCFCSLRLSVRTPPFHGGESGSIPLGSATSAARYRFFLFSLNDLANHPNAWWTFYWTARRPPRFALSRARPDLSAGAPRPMTHEAIEPVSDHPEHGAKYAPLSDRPDQELAVFKRDDDPISCGRRHLARAPAGYPKDRPMHFGSARIGRCD